MAQKITIKNEKKSYQGKKTLEVLEGANDYNTWIGETLSQYLVSPILEIGAGTGNITKFFLRKGKVHATDIDEELLAVLQTKFNRYKNVAVSFLNIAKRPPLKYQQAFNSVVGVNVLEHIKLDVEALKNIRLTLRKGGRLILLVPAKKNAYTKLDKSLGHFRRYEKKELRDKLLDAGFTIEELYFFNFLGLFTWVLRDKISQTHTQLSPTHIALFDKIVYLLKVIEKYIPIPVGISLIVVAKK